MIPRKRHILFIISAVILIPVLLSLTPVKFVEKLGGNCPLAKSKAALGCNPCIYHSISSKNVTGDLAQATLPSTPVVVQLLSLLSGETVYSAATVDSSPPTETPPLRC
jgi:hypothetical protein